jgi:hypothetical protein
MEPTYVQPQDTVLVDFVGYYCDDETKAVLFPGDDVTDNLFNPSDNIATGCATTTMYTVRQYFQNNNVPVFHMGQDVLCVIGEKDVVPALEMGIRFMQSYETSIIYSHSKYAYGLSKRTYKYNNTPSTPPNSCISESNDANSDVGGPTSFTLQPESNVIYIVTLKRIVTSQAVNQPRFQLRLCLSKKMLANDIYQCDFNDNIKSNMYAHRAIHIYQRAADLLESILISAANRQEPNTDDVDSRAATDLSNVEIDAARNCQIDCLNNIVAVYMKCQLYHKAKEACVAVLKVDVHNVKALFRAAKAALYDPASSYDEVQAAIQAVEEEIQQQHSSKETDTTEQVIVLRRI